ncbi:unnamed protein product, partial [Didymodactylos carnosus]
GHVRPGLVRVAGLVRPGHVRTTAVRAVTSLPANTPSKSYADSFNFEINRYIKLETDSVSYETCLNLLNQIPEQQLPDLVVEHILSFLKKQMWKNEDEAKEFRARVRREMRSEVHGWSGIQYGNEGEIQFVNSDGEWKRLKKSSSGDDYRPCSHIESE